MSKVQISPPAANDASAFREPGQDDASVCSLVTQVGFGDASGIGQGTGLDGHSLLSRLPVSHPAAPQGRRSLFRR